MATKLRSFSTSIVTKIVAMGLFAACMTMLVTQVFYVVYKNYDPECLVVSEYKNSSRFFYDHVSGAMDDTNNIVAAAMNKPSDAERFIRESLKDREYYYFVKVGEQTYSNTGHMDKEFYAKYDRAFYGFHNNAWEKGKNTYRMYFSSYNDMKGDTTIYIAFSDKYLDEQQVKWQQSRDELMPFVVRGVCGVLISILLVVFLISVTGRKAQDRELHMSFLDSIYSDVLAAAFIFSLFIYAFGMSEITRYGYSNSDLIESGEYYRMVEGGLLTAIVSVACGVLVLSMVRKIKARKLLRHSFIFTVCFMVYDFFRSLFDGRRFERYPLTKSLFYRQVLFIIGSATLVFFAFFFFIIGTGLVLIPIIFEIVLIYLYVNGNNGTFELINKGFNESLEEQMKAERMKIALVTNVSHDLKTPLTSIISYIDLLSKAEEFTEETRDYVRILQEKSNRLKTIVADLFDLAKSTSGDISLDVERIDMKKLIEQTLADMEDRIQESGLQFKIKLPDKPVHIMADGKKLYRVMQNIVDNSLKYSLKGTRVFVELEEADGRAVAAIKNTAGYEMDFTAYEILQRFNRGDKTRSTEGSGLGLSIAESFTNVCGGNFKVDVDGDLFKVMISFRAIA